MLREIRLFSLIGCVALLTACAVLPKKTTEAIATSSPGLQLVYQDRQTLLYVRPGYDVSGVRHLAVGKVNLQEPPHLSAPDQSEQETLAKDLQSRLSAAFHRDNSAPDLYVDVNISDIEPVSPLLNVATTLLVFAPLDTGALTIDSIFRDKSGRVDIRRVDRLAGSILNLRASFTRYGQHHLALEEYAQRCSIVQACLNKPAQ